MRAKVTPSLASFRRSVRGVTPSLRANFLQACRSVRQQRRNGVFDIERSVPVRALRRASASSQYAIRREQAPRDLISTLIYFCSDDSNFVAARPSASTTAR
jgi:hypothetical protein